MSQVNSSKEFINHPSKNKKKQNDSKHLDAIKPYIAKENKNQKKSIINKIQIPTPFQNSRYKTKRNDSYYNLDSLKSNKNLGEISHELINLKAQYNSLKLSFNKIVKEKQKANKDSLSQQMKLEIFKKQSQAYKEVQKYKNIIRLMQEDRDKTKHQFHKIIEMQKYKIVKLQQTLQEKQLMIFFLRSQLTNPLTIDQSISQHPFFFKNTMPNLTTQINTNNHKPSKNNSIASSTPLPKISEKPITLEQKSNFENDYSISFSDQSKQLENDNNNLEHHNFLTFTKKDVIILQESFSEGQNNQGQQECLTFQNRNDQNNKNIGNLQQKIKTKRNLHIITDQNQKCMKEGQSLETKKRANKKKIKPSKRKSQLKK